MTPAPSKHLLAVGFLVGRTELTNFLFDPRYPYRCCLLCGEMLQTELDRSDDINVQIMRHVLRQEWANSHAKTHPAKLHHELRLSGQFALPEAAQKLAAFGIFSLNDLAFDTEVTHALATAPRAPVNDAITH